MSLQRPEVYSSLSKLVLVFWPKNNKNASEGSPVNSGSIAATMRYLRCYYPLHNSVTFRFWPRGALWEDQPISRDSFLHELIDSLASPTGPLSTTQRYGSENRDVILSFELPRHQDDPLDMPDWWRRMILARLSSRMAERQLLHITVTVTVMLHSMIGRVHRLPSHRRLVSVVTDRPSFSARLDPYATVSSTNQIWIPAAAEPTFGSSEGRSTSSNSPSSSEESASSFLPLSEDEA